MKNSNDIFNANLVGIGRKVAKNANAKSHEQENFLVEVLSVLLFANAQALFVLFRYKFGGSGISLPRLIIAFVFFIGVAARLLYVFYDPQNFVGEYGSAKSYFVTAILLIVFAMLFLIKGIVHIATTKGSSNYPGDSFLLSFLTKDKSRQKIVQKFAEPLCMVLIGGTYCFYNLWGGLVIGFCGLSVWGSMAVESFYLANRIQSDINSQSSNRDNNISQVR